MPSPGAPPGCRAQLWLLSPAGPGSSWSGAGGGCAAEEGPGAAPCPAQAEGAGAAQPREEPQLRGALSPGCPWLQGGLRAGPRLCSGAQQWHQSTGQGLSPAIALPRRQNCCPGQCPALSRLATEALGSPPWGWCRAVCTQCCACAPGWPCWSWEVPPGALCSLQPEPSCGSLYLIQKLILSHSTVPAQRN